MNGDFFYHLFFLHQFSIPLHQRRDTGGLRRLLNAEPIQPHNRPVQILVRFEQLRRHSERVAL